MATGTDGLDPGPRMRSTPWLPIRTPPTVRGTLGAAAPGRPPAGTSCGSEVPIRQGNTLYREVPGYVPRSVGPTRRLRTALMSVLVPLPLGQGQPVLSNPGPRVPPRLTYQEKSHEHQEQQTGTLGAAALVLGGSLLGTLTGAGAASAAELERYGGPTRGGATAAAGTAWRTAAAPLDAAEVTALNKAIKRRWRAQYLPGRACAAREHLPVQPDRRGAAAREVLARLFTGYGLEVPANPGLVPAPAFASLTAAARPAWTPRSWTLHCTIR